MSKEIAIGFAIAAILVGGAGVTAYLLGKNNCVKFGAEMSAPTRYAPGIGGCYVRGADGRWISARIYEDFWRGK